MIDLLQPAGFAKRTSKVFSRVGRAWALSPALPSAPGQERPIVSLYYKQSSIGLDDIDLLDLTPRLVCERMGERRADRRLRQLRSRLAAIGYATGDRRISCPRIGNRRNRATRNKNCHHRRRYYLDHPRAPRVIGRFSHMSSPPINGVPYFSMCLSQKAIGRVRLPKGGAIQIACSAAAQAQRAPRTQNRGNVRPGVTAIPTRTACREQLVTGLLPAKRHRDEQNDFHDLSEEFKVWTLYRNVSKDPQDTDTCKRAGRKHTADTSRASLAVQ